MRIDSAHQAQTLLLELSSQALKEGTFAVGAFLAGEDGHVLATVTNKVIQKGRLADPTAHAERQLIDWHAAMRHQFGRHKLPDPEQLTIYSSLDPCMMCAASIIKTGFNVVSFGLDNTAGVSEDRPGYFRALSLPQLTSLNEKARGQFAYVGVAGERDYVGPSGRLYSGWKIEKADEEKLFNILIQSLSVRDKIAHANRKNEWPNINQMQPEALELLASHLNACHCKTYADSKYPTSPDRLAAQMQRTARASREWGAGYDAAAILSPYGQPLAVCGSATDLSPIRTAMVEVVRNYTRAQAHIVRELRPYLPNLRDCMIVTLNAPDLSTETKALNSQLMMGVYGSCMEKPITGRADAPLKFVKVGATDGAMIEAWYESFPSLYRDIFVQRPAMVDKKIADDFDRFKKLEEENHALCGQYPAAPFRHVTMAPALTSPGVTALV